VTIIEDRCSKKSYEVLEETLPGKNKTGTSTGVLLCVKKNPRSVAVANANGSKDKPRGKAKKVSRRPKGKGTMSANSGRRTSN